MNTLPRLNQKDSLVDGDVNHIRQGSDPLIQTARSKQQNRRCKLNAQINREMRLRAGAENLYKATTNQKLKESVALELRLVNSNLQLLKEDLTELNDSVQIYQSSSASHRIPMIPLGLKETNDAMINQVMARYIREHYWEDASLYLQQIQKFMDLRQASRTPVRNEEGIKLLFSYFNHLYFIDRRFFPPNKGTGVLFEWYDSITGVPNSQTTIGYEKGAILFNISALYTQMGAKQDRTTSEGLVLAMESFQRAAGSLHFLLDNFSNSPSMDMQPATLSMLKALMMAQASECQLERILMEDVSDNMRSHIDFAHEAIMVSELYLDTFSLMSAPPMNDYVPFSWVSMVEVKSHYYRALAHYHVATAVLDQKDSGNFKTMVDCFKGLHIHEVRVGSVKRGEEQSPSIETRPPRNAEERQTFAKAHLRQSILANENALRIHGITRQQRKIDTFQDVLKAAHNRSLRRFAALEDEDDFSELLTAPRIKCHSSCVLESIIPDFTSVKVEDLFHGLGPLAIFSASHEWSAPKKAELRRREGEEFGFSVRGDSPVIVAVVEDKSLAKKSGMKVGDFIIGVGETSMKWCRHEDVVSHIKAAGNHLVLILVTPLDRDYLAPTPPTQHHHSNHTHANGSTVAMQTGDKEPKSGKQGGKIGRLGDRRRSSSGLLPWKIKNKSLPKDDKTGGVNGMEAGSKETNSLCR